jgi:cellulose synthase/poly-beta-1,6-N-acetylglucosamine synthase-like glycosyltransferase
MGFVILILAIYGLFILHLIFGTQRIEPFQSVESEPKNRFSILVSFRNEKDNLPNLLQSLSELNYPKELFEVIFIDDNSTDNYTIPHQSYSHSIIQNKSDSLAPKKDAIELGIQQAKNEWIVTTDADCLVPKNWLLSFDQYIQSQPTVQMICGAVFTQTDHRFLQDFQLLDFMSLQSTTLGSFGISMPFMCNGANFCYHKSLFEELNGFEGNIHLASGDDVFLLQKALKKHTKQVHYLNTKENTVLTQPVSSWNALLKQRIRWASKTSAYKSIYPKILAFVIFYGNIAFIIAVLSLIFTPNLGFLIVAKIIFDFVLILQSSHLAPKFHFKNYLLSSLVYPIFTLLIGINVLFVKQYTWKNQTHSVK